MLRIPKVWMFPMDQFDPHSRWQTMKTIGGNVDIVRLRTLEDHGAAPLEQLPYSIRILLENVLRRIDQPGANMELNSLLESPYSTDSSPEISFLPSRILLQDFTGIPAFVDLAAARDAMSAMGKDPKKINPIVPVDLVIDHSIQAIFYGNKGALPENERVEMILNKQRYIFLKW